MTVYLMYDGNYHSESNNLACIAIDDNGKEVSYTTYFEDAARANACSGKVTEVSELRCVRNTNGPINQDRIQEWTQQQAPT